MEDQETGSGEYTVVAALVTGAHGVGGNVRLRLMETDSDSAVRSLDHKVVHAVRPGEEQPSRELTVQSLRRQPGPKGAWIARFQEIKDRSQAEELLGAALMIPEQARAALPPGEYYIDQIVGLEAVTDTGHSLGKVSEVLSAPASDVYATDQGILIPAVAAFVLDIDLESGKITVHDMPGLRDNT